MKNVSINICSDLISKKFLLTALFAYICLALISPETAFAHRSSHCALAQDKQGIVYMASEKKGTIECLWDDGSRTVFTSGLNSPCCLAFNSQRTLYVGTQSGELWSISPTGTQKLLRKDLPPITGILVDRDRTIILATPQGTLLRISPSQ